MALTPEQQARVEIDAALEKAGWVIQDRDAANIRAARGVVVREFQLRQGYGAADYLIFVDGRAVGVIEAKRQGATLTGVEIQAEKYSVGLPDLVSAPIRPLPFLYQSTGVETRFTNLLDPAPRSREVFHFHRPEMLAQWLKAKPLESEQSSKPSTLRSRLRAMPPFEQGNLWDAQFKAVRNLEISLRDDRPRALIQMATGSGKTFTAVTAAYRFIKHADAQRILFLVDRGNLGRQSLKEFQQYTTPDDGRKFTELYNIQHLTSNSINPVSRVVISTIQRLYSMLQGKELDPEAEEGSQYDTGAALISEPVPVAYNPALPIEFFDIIFIDECHRSIYSLWRQVLEYFDAHLIGLTATPSKQTFGFFNQNLVMEYNHEQAVADGVNVDFDVYKIRTRITDHGSVVEAGPFETIGRRDRETRAVRWEKLDEDLSYDSDKLDRQVVAKDQIRTIIKTFKEKLFTEIFPNRTDVPKTLIYAKDDSHADDIVQIVREEFGRGNDFCEKITYRTGTARIVTKDKDKDGNDVERITYKATGISPDNLLSSFRNSYNPRIVVTVDMIATGTDIKPLEIVMFMRSVKSRNFFEQMKGRGVRIINDTDFQTVTTDAKAKTHFVIVDCVGVCEQELSETYPLERKRNVSLESLLNAVAFGSLDTGVLSSVASRLSRLEHRLNDDDRNALAELVKGRSLKAIAADIITALDPDKHIEEARRIFDLSPDVQPSEQEIKEASESLLMEATQPIAANPEFRNRLLAIKLSYEQTIDETSKDEVLEAGYSDLAAERARGIVQSFSEFIEANKDEITALQVLYSRPYAKRLQRSDLKKLAEAIKMPPRSWTTEKLWNAYETLERNKVRGAGSARLMTDLVSLVRHALGQDSELVPFKELVEERFQSWLAQQENQGRKFTSEQRQWLELIRDHITANLQIEVDDFDYVPFTQRGGAGKAFQVFGDDLEKVLNELNEVLAA
ncbi:MAG TPA: type I restriction-modification enzyme R subunit C-terminal domain-containing protein [Blastocatellia bacterium]|nr:type I restriction-modification enzyme R subunit C-terminal domain-containing protein [Blastocatellia bacterium]